MNWESRFADRTRLMQQSTVREFLKHAARPGIISFAGGLPDPDLLPVEETRAAVDKALTTNGARMLQYGLTEGIPELRERVANRFRGAGATAENVLITTGSQQALDLIGRVLLNEGAKVIVQNPTYLAALSAWRPYGATFIPAENGSFLPVEEGSAADLIYCIPNFNNPTGESLNQNERSTLVQASLRNRVPLLEDDPYGDLRYNDSPKPPSLLETAGLDASVVHIGTFSKILAPGFRIGWIVAHRDLIAKLALAKQSLDLHTSTFAQYVVLHLLEAGTLERSLQRLRTCYAQKRDNLLQALTLYMSSPPIRWTQPVGGFFLLLTLGDALDGASIARGALDYDVLVVPGADFHVQGGRNTLRLCFSSIPATNIGEGIIRLSHVLHSVG